MPAERPILTVTQLNEYVKGIIDSDKVLAGLSVKGAPIRCTWIRSSPTAWAS